MLKKIASLVAAVGIALVGFAAPASATPKLTGSLPATSVENTTVPLAFTLAGADWTKALVTVTVAEGTLTVVASGDVVAASGCDLAVGSASQSFYGSTADIVTTRSEGIDWLTPSTPGSYNINFTVKVQEYVVGLSYNPANGHYYLVPADEFGDPITDTAESFYIAADDGDYTYAGITGYLAEINDEAENDFVANFSGGSNIWIGGSAESGIIDGYGPGGASDLVDEWYWIHSGTQFASGLDEDVAGADTADIFGDAFTSFAVGEPNGGNTGSEGCLVTNVGGNLGMWNDLTCFGTNKAAIIEFEPTGTESAILTLTDEDIPLAETGVEANGIVLLAGALALAGAGAVVYRRRRV